MEHKDNEIVKLKEIVKDYWMKMEVRFSNKCQVLVCFSGERKNRRSGKFTAGVCKC